MDLGHALFPEGRDGGAGCMQHSGGRSILQHLVWGWLCLHHWGGGGGLLQLWGWGPAGLRQQSGWGHRVVVHNNVLD